VSMNFVSAARRVGHRKYETFFAGNVREGLGHDLFYVGRWSSGRELRGERISSDCDRQDDLFHGDSVWFSSDLLFFQILPRRSSATAGDGELAFTSTFIIETPSPPGSVALSLRALPLCLSSPFAPFIFQRFSTTASGWLH